MRSRGAGIASGGGGESEEVGGGFVGGGVPSVGVDQGGHRSDVILEQRGDGVVESAEGEWALGGGAVPFAVSVGDYMD